MSLTSDQMELREEEIRAHYDAATAMLEGFDHTPRIGRPRDVAAVPERSPGIAHTRRFRATTPGLVTRSTARPEGVQLIARIEAADGNDPLISPLQATVIHALRRALAIALAVGEAFSGMTGLGALKRANLEGSLGADKRAEFGELLEAEALVTLHVFANATAFLLAPHQTEVTVEVGTPEELLTDNAQLALHGCLWELDQDIAALGTDEARMVATIAGFAEQLMEKVALRAQTAPRVGPFTAASWRVEADDLPIDGFTPARKARGTRLTMQFRKPHEVVGNHIAKYQALRLAKMLMAYDFDRRLNPFAELGGFIFTFMGDGKPGTGKTTLIQMMAGLLHEYCQNAGYPFRYQNFGIDNIDSYQGKSGQNAKAFVQNVLDPSVIGFGTIDDIDQIAGKRGDRQSSAGQQEVTAVFMEAFAGANTVVRGNCTFGMFSNYPENVDDALRQRAGARFLVDGPQTRADYIDILALLMGKRHDIPLGDHELYAAQEIKRAVAASFESHNRPHEEGLLHVWERVEGQIGELDTIAKLGTYLKAIQEADERFTGRAIKNITDAVKVRAMDFELPDEWMENPELFLFRSYDEKSAMISELRRPITVDMVVQEINRYADSEFRYADKSDEVAIDGMVRDMRRTEEAKKRYLEGRDG
ncbi:ATPase family associated with various cellular activities (AAA) [Lutimaribacter pacificus]|uniref:ATPase family associated with various cellular activities (AAA) n=1 Tax=Lutimaribacter pacificus TaxID=391948 RepID=A0A1H0HZV4_9RHOB|nr:ATP-binding protein [Lutimaribacter pacificus]SDO24639.1 ATPase family associated with various cellular activities (AAA) [Lutimaribacter pacificus]SHK28994.1 ATPase family associated with various cellular activities (AAA) [Lutimaribacter pacificus]